MEVWKDIEGYEGHYQVSDFGKVKSLKHGREMILKLCKNYDGYLQIGLHLHKNKKMYTVHQLVAIAFLGHKPGEDGFEVDHIHNIRSDNRVSELQLIPHRENCSKDKWRLNSSSNSVGVYWGKKRKKWISQITIDSKCKYLGSFDLELHAMEAYKKALNNYNSGKNIEVKKHKFSSEYKGVHWNSELNRWRSQMWVDGKTKFIGHFDTELEASEAHNKVLKEYNNGASLTTYSNFSSSHKGVSLIKKTGRWVSYLKINKKRKHIGTFNTEQEAYEAQQYYKKHGRGGESSKQDN